jgi:hypothetical protein
MPITITPTQAGYTIGETVAVVGTGAALDATEYILFLSDDLGTELQELDRATSVGTDVDFGNVELPDPGAGITPYRLQARDEGFLDILDSSQFTLTAESIAGPRRLGLGLGLGL